MSEQARFILRMKFWTETEPYSHYSCRSEAFYRACCDRLQVTAGNVIGFMA